MKKISAFIMVILTFFTAAASSTPIIIHEGSNNPVAEGWTRGGFASSNSLHQDGISSWSMEKRRSFEYRHYSYIINSDDLTLAKQLGWSFSFEVQYSNYINSTINGVYAQINTNGKVWSAHIGGQPDLDQTFFLGYGGQSYIHEGSGEIFHNYEFRYDPLDQLIDVYINGILVFENIDGGYSSRPDGTGTISWGLSPSSAIGRGNFSWVDFSINHH